MNIKQVTLPDGSIGIELDDGSKPDGYVEDIMSYMDISNDKKIAQELIDECERLYLTDGKHRFIFDRLTTNLINSKNKSVEESRDIAIDSILNLDEYYISDYSEFDRMPSRFSFYDTETKLTCRYKRYQLVVEFLTKLQFQPGLANLGPELEQSYILRIDNCNCIFRLRPNLFFDLSVDDYSTNMTHLCKGFFNKEKIVKFLSDNTPEIYKSVLRENKLEGLLN